MPIQCVSRDFTCSKRLFNSSVAFPSLLFMQVAQIPASPGSILPPPRGVLALLFWCGVCHFPPDPPCDHVSIIMRLCAVARDVASGPIEIGIIQHNNAILSRHYPTWTTCINVPLTKHRPNTANQRELDDERKSCCIPCSACHAYRLCYLLALTSAY